MEEPLILNLTATPGKQETVITQDFEARRELVFQAHTDPNLIPQWWEPARLTTTIDQLDLRPGGMWRFVQRDAEGNEYAFHGVYHEVAAPKRLVYTFEFEGRPGISCWKRLHSRSRTARPGWCTSLSSSRWRTTTRCCRRGWSPAAAALSIC